MVGECCQASDRTVAMSEGGGALVTSGLVPAAPPTNWFLVCTRCAPEHGVTGVVVGRLRDDTPKPPHCSNQDNMSAASPNHPVSSELVQCRHCNRWLCDVCRYSYPPWSCRECPELRSAMRILQGERHDVVKVSFRRWRSGDGVSAPVAQSGDGVSAPVAQCLIRLLDIACNAFVTKAVVPQGPLPRLPPRRTQHDGVPRRSRIARSASLRPGTPVESAMLAAAVVFGSAAPSATGAASWWASAARPATEPSRCQRVVEH